ncbi:hypothetical protein BGX28_001668 [Mortierella sp. GBA30]|nr:hypothetical protein BGX28_001668 [Mortierella sp. GBA30]
MTDKDNIFEVPRILTLIASNLSRSDLASMSRVARAWHNTCTSGLWRHIESDLEVWNDKAFLRALPTHAHLIRRLEGPEPTPTVLRKFIPGCTQLTHLNGPVVDSKNIIQTALLIGQNPGLEDLALQFLKWESFPKQIAQVFRAIGRLKNLKSLAIEYGWNDPRVGEYLVKRLPKLKHLQLESFYRMPMQELPNDLDLSENEGETQPALLMNHLYVDGLPSVKYVAEVARHCPNLTSITMATDTSMSLEITPSAVLRTCSQLLRRHCPKLDQLHLRSHHAHNEPGLVDFLSTGFPKLRAFTAEGSVVPEAGLLRAILAAGRICNYPETVELIHMLPIMEPNVEKTSRLVLDIVSCYPKLKALLLETCEVDAVDMVRRIRSGQPWVCKNLSAMSLNIKGPTRGWTRPGVVQEHPSSSFADEDDDVDMDQTWGKYQLFDAVMEQLQALPELKDFRAIRFCYPE